MNHRFRPIDLKIDKEVISNFLQETHKISSVLIDNPTEDVKRYCDAIISKQKRDSRFCSLLIENDRIIGLVDAFPLKKNPYEGFVSFFYLVEDKRGCGFGKILEDYAISLLKEYQCREANLEVSENNTRALKFYQKHGWDIYARTGHDNFIKMKKVLI